MNSHQDKPQADGLISKQQIASLFKGWKRLFVKKMNDDDWQADTVTVWYIALNDLGMTQSEFEISKRKSLGMQWACTAPADFLALARGDALTEYPASEQAFRLACEAVGTDAKYRKPFPHVVINETVNRIGEYTLKTANSGYFKAWNTVYSKVVFEHSQGAVFEIPESHQLGYAGDKDRQENHKPAPKEIAESYLEKCRKALGKSSSIEKSPQA